MRKIKAIAILLAVISVLLVSCRKPEEFEPAPIITTTRAVTEEASYVYSDFKIFNMQMGMSIEETLKAAGQGINLILSEKGQYYFTLNKKGLPFVSKDLEVPVYFIFDGKNRLCEIQYESSASTGFKLDSAIKDYDKKYGKHIVVEDGTGKVNYVWYSEGVYILITTVLNGRNAMTFAGEEFFKQNNPEEYKAYNG